MKDFLIIGLDISIRYKDVFPFIKNNKVWYVPTSKGFLNFICPDGSVEKKQAVWFTNIGKNNKKPLELTERYSPEKYPKFDNYDIIEVSKSKDIPMDYSEAMAVPLTFFYKYCPEQFEIITIACSYSYNTFPETLKELGFNPEIRYATQGGLGGAILNGKGLFDRLIIKRKNNDKNWN